ncbi:helix-turn-helix domain-containing protein [Peribacillus alkalitolerans]|uniref:helix-turn-helix domain-containing protein n=1 Tax=Peribacillus alkalitolerans TaxID=1550385 RepID=UPI0013D0EB56|nr:helix-turn-helix transcriptional regulator [Peribacillus alkalitolerans]
MKCNIDKLIKERGFKKQFIAQQLEITAKQLRNYELMESYIPIPKAYKLAKILNVKVDDLYEVEE